MIAIHDLDQVKTKGL